MAAELTEQNNNGLRTGAQFRTLIIAADDRRHSTIQEAAVETGAVMPMRSPVGYPAGRELTTVMNHAEPELVLLDLLDPAKAADSAECVWERFPKTVVIGVGARNLGDLTLAAPYPPLPDQLERMIHRGMHLVRGKREPGLFVFLPAKAGCGASTTALNMAGAWAALGKRVLLVDADLHSGALGVMVETENGYSLQQVLRGISELDRFRLEQAVANAHGFDLLLSDGTPVTPAPGWNDYFRILDIARPRYDIIVVDLPERVNPATQEFVQRAQEVYIVATQEVVPLKLVARRREELAAYGAKRESVHLVINRWQRGDFGTEDVEKIAGQPIFHRIPNDYRGVRKSLETGQLVPPGSGLGRAYRELAERAAGIPRHGIGASLSGLFSRKAG